MDTAIQNTDETALTAQVDRSTFFRQIYSALHRPTDSPAMMNNGLEPKPTYLNRNALKGILHRDLEQKKSPKLKHIRFIVHCMILR
jgi:hypothetical protein